MTKKGLAVGAGLALVATGFAAPAHAAAGIDITAANSKSVYGMLEGEAFSFTIAGNADFNAAQQGLLRVEAVNVSGGAAASAISINATALTNLNDIDLLGSGTTADVMDADAGDAAVFGLGDGTTSIMTTPFTFSFVSTAAADKAQAYDVTAFVDANNDGVRQAGELASPTRRVTWYDSSKVEVSIAIDAPTAGDTATGADITSTQIALDQLTAAEIGVEYTLGTGAAIVAGVYADAVSQNAANPAILESDLGTITALTAADAVKAQLVFKTANVDVANPTVGNTAVGAPATLAVAATSVHTITGSIVDSATGQTAASATQVLNKGTWSAAALVVSTATGNPALAGQAVTAKITTSRALSATETLTVGGVTYTASATLPGATGVATLAVGTSDATGTVSLPITTAGMTDADTVVVTFYTSNKSGAVTATLKDAVYSGYLENVNGGTVSTTDGTAVSVDVVVLDQFGGTAPAGYKARSVFDAAATTAAGAQATLGASAASGSEVALVNGRGTLSILDNGTGVGTNVYDVGFNTGVAGAADTEIQANLNVKIVKAENTATGGFTLTDATPTALALNAAQTGYVMTAGQRGASDAKLPIQNMNGATKRVFKNFDARSELGAAAPNVAADDTVNRATIAGVVSSSFSNTVAQTVLANATITFSGAGLQFQTTENGAAVWGNESLTVQANAVGAFSVQVYSQKAGLNTVTVTSGTVSKTVFLYSDVAATDSATSLTVSAPDNILPGRTLAVTGLLTDRFGNPRTSAATDPFAVTYSGPGYAQVMPTATNANGAFAFNVLLGSNDTGTATITAYYDIDGDGLYTSTGDLVVTKTVTIGAAPVADTTKVNAGSFKGFVAVYAKGHLGKRLSAKVGKDWVVVAALDSNFVRVVEYTGAGYTIAVRIYIDRVLVNTITVTTK